MRGPLRNLLRLRGLRKVCDARSGLRLACRNAGYRLAGAPDGLPIPPVNLIYAAMRLTEISWYFNSGQLGAQSIISTLRENELSMEDFGTVLDFGCGCGRLIRQWRDPEVPRLHGTDCNPEQIEWCARKLGGLAQFRANKLEPPLDYQDETFDFVYAASVFTHLPEGLQYAWQDELKRVLKPGGYLLITTYGRGRLFQMISAERKLFLSGSLVVRGEADAGTNACAAFHPEEFVRTQLAKGLELVDFLPGKSRDTDQDISLFTKS